MLHIDCGRGIELSTYFDVQIAAVSSSGVGATTSSRCTAAAPVAQPNPGASLGRRRNRSSCSTRNRSTVSNDENDGCKAKCAVAVGPW